MYRLASLSKALVLSGVVVTLACSGGDGASVEPKPSIPNPEVHFVVSLTPKRDTLAVGLSRLLTARVVDGAGATQNVQVQWTSLQPSVASVSGGNVTAVSAGSVAIVASYGAASDTATLVVTAEAVHLQVWPSAISATLGDTVSFSAQLVTESGVALGAQAVSWAATSQAVAVLGNGQVEMLGVGDVDVIAQVGQMTATASVNVSAAAVASIIINPSSASIIVGGTVNLNAAVQDLNGRNLRFRHVTWSSSNEAVGVVNATGNVTGITRGGVIITASSGGKSATVTVNVSSKPARSVTLSTSVDTMTVGLRAYAVATPRDGDGNAITGRPVAYQSSNPAVATVNNLGVIVGLVAGSTNISAICDGFIATVKLMVQVQHVASISIVPGAPSVQQGSTATLVADIKDQAGQSMTAAVIWTAQSPSKVSVSASGVVTGVALGSGLVTASTGGKSSQANVTVTGQSVTTVHVSPSSASIYPTQTTSLGATAFGVNGFLIAGAAFAWTVTDAAVASVSPLGVVTGKVKGTTTVTATSAGKSNSATITVTDPPLAPVATVNVTVNSPTLITLQTTQAVAQLLDAAGTVLTGRAISWSSATPSVATVSATGLITAVAPGSVTIAALSEGVSGLVTITVTIPPAAPVASVTVSSPNGKVLVGLYTQLTVVLQDAQAKLLSGRNVSYSSSNTAVATVSPSGLVHGVAAGTVTISVTSEGIIGQAVIVVHAPAGPPIVDTVTVRLNARALQVPQTTQAIAVVKDSLGNIMLGKTIIWSSSNVIAATVNSSGLVTTVGAGVAVISGSTSGKSGADTATVTVPPAVVASVAVTLNSGSIQSGQTTQAIAVVKDSSGNVLTGKVIAWSSSNVAVATVDSMGLVHALGVGSAVISGQTSSKAGSATLTVPLAPVVVATVGVSLNPRSVMVGQTSLATAAPKDSLGTLLPGQTITWSSSNVAVGTVSSTGVVSAIGAGKTVISGSTSGKTGSDTLSVTVAPAVVASVTVSLNSTSLAIGQTGQATALVKDSSGNVLTNHVITWSSSKTAVATVDSAGAVKIVGAGATVISGATANKSGNATLNGTAPGAVLTSIVVTMGIPSLNVGQSSQATAVGKDAQGNPMVVTFVWSVSSTSILSVTSTGMVTGVAAGSAQVIATASGVTGSLTVPVTVLAPSPVMPPALPQVYLNFPYTPATGQTITVPAGGNLQNAINSAQRGDEIVLPAGATFTGNFTLPAKSGAGWVTIRTAQLSQLPPEGTRVTSANANLMPKIVTANAAGALATLPGASFYRLVGLEITVTASYAGPQYGLVLLGDGSHAQNTLAMVPTDLVLDRVYVHGQATTQLSRCVALNSARTQITDSYLTECHAVGQDSQAIAGWNGPGPFKIVNNTLIGAGENLMFGGADPGIPGMVPHDMEIRRNYIYTPASWKGVWEKKNLFELKVGQRILVEGNVFEGSWDDAQTGWAVLMKAENQSGTCTWCTASDITFRYNYIRNVGAGIAISGRQGVNVVGALAARFSVQNNVIENVSVGAFTGDQRFYQVLANAQDVEITNNTSTSTGFMKAFMALDNVNSATRLAFNKNATTLTAYGLTATGRASGTASLAAVVGGWQFNGNYLIGPSTSGYPAGTTFLSSLAAVPSGVGADQATLNAKIAGVIIP